LTDIPASFHDLDAERAVLGAVLTNGKLFPKTDSLLEDDFWHPFHAQIFSGMRSLYQQGHPIDALTVASEMEVLGLWGKGHDRTELIGLMENVGVLSNLPAHVHRVKDMAQRRDAVTAAQKAMQIVQSPQIAVEDALRDAEKVLRNAVPLTKRGADLMTLDQFVDQDIEEAAWVVNPLLRRGERLVVTGFEGLGKTTLMRQIGVATAAGLEPFTLRNAPPKKVLFVDCENPEHIMQQSFGQLRDVLRRRHKTTDDRFLLKRHPGGMNLSKPRDRALLRSYCTDAQPDLLLIGPAYKLYLGGAGQREEDLARVVVDALDELREEFDLSLILEHHSPHHDTSNRGAPRDVRPIGSSLWLRWPEFGWGIRPKKGGNAAKREVEVVSWRGPRDPSRQWPVTMVSGGKDSLPWVDPARLVV